LTYGVCCLLLVFVLSIGGESACAVAASALKVYNSQGLADSLSRAALRAIFFLKVKTWPDGTPIRVFVLNDVDPMHARFCKEVLGLYPYQLRTSWDRMVYSGTGLGPVTVNSPKEMRARLEATPGGIGYLSE
jgi:ABC-type phosphate transport system, periplasmic component